MSFNVADTFTTAEALGLGILKYRSSIADTSNIAADTLVVQVIEHPRADEYPEGYYLERKVNGDWYFYKYA